jgi:5-methylcytosine-specific restriction enzyme A
MYWQVSSNLSRQSGGHAISGGTVRMNGWISMRAPDPRVVELSNLLQGLPIHPVEVRGPRFRNANGFGRKTSDIATHHPDYTGTPTNAGAPDLEVRKDF